MQRIHRLALLAALTLTLPGCDLVGDILEFGLWVGVILVVLIALGAWGIARTLKGKPRNRTEPPPPTGAQPTGGQTPPTGAQPTGGQTPPPERETPPPPPPRDEPPAGTV